MTRAKATTLGLALIFSLLFILDYAPFTQTIAQALHLAPPSDAIHLAGALLGFCALALGARAATVYLVSIGILIIVNGIGFCATGVSLADFAMGYVSVAPWTSRLILGPLYSLMGVAALYEGAKAADDIQDHTMEPPPS